MTNLCCLPGALLALGCLGAAAVPAAGPSDPLAAYVLLAQQTAPSGAGAAQVALARVVMGGAGADCPDLVGDDGRTRAMMPRRNPDPAHFPITVCEALYPRDGSRLRVGAGIGPRLPAVTGAAARIAVLGDTGCKPARQRGCSPPHWPFAALAKTIAAAAPPLVLHMGDYNYRGTPRRISVAAPDHGTRKLPVYDADDNASGAGCGPQGHYIGQNSPGSRMPDTWDAWQADFFTPAAPLLAAAPWVFARGNHELCSRAGPGWFYLLDAGSDLLGPGAGQRGCPHADSAEPLVFVPAYRVDLDGVSVLVMDSANACDIGDLHQAHFDAEFARVQQLAEGAPAGQAVWLVSHRPLWALNEPFGDPPPRARDDSGRYVVISQTLETAQAAHPLPASVPLVLSGHLHLFQALDFDPPDPRPAQLLVGNSGVALFDDPLGPDIATRIDGAPVSAAGLGAFGWMELLPGDTGGWRGRLLGPGGEALLTCDSARAPGRPLCERIGP